MLSRVVCGLYVWEAEKRPRTDSEVDAPTRSGHIGGDGSWRCGRACELFAQGDSGSHAISGNRNNRPFVAQRSATPAEASAGRC